MSKYRSVPTIVDGIRFHSAGEARRYQELKLLERAGKISGLSRQVKFPIKIEGKVVTTYIADFEYRKTGDAFWTVEDYKGFMTPLARLKIKLFEAIWTHKILITGAAAPKPKIFVRRTGRQAA